MDHNELERWAINAAQELQELVDDAEAAVAPDDRGDVALSTKVLIAEFDDIFAGRPTWRHRLATDGDDDASFSLLDT